MHARDRAACVTATSRGRGAVKGRGRPTAGAGAGGTGDDDHRHRSGRRDREGRRSAAEAESVALSLWSVVPVAAEPADVWRNLHLAVVRRARPSGSGSGSAGHARGPRRTPDISALRKCAGALSMHQSAAPPAGAIHSHFEVASPYPRPSLVELAECTGRAGTRRFCLSLNTGSSVRMVLFAVDRPSRLGESPQWAV